MWKKPECRVDVDLTKNPLSMYRKADRFCPICGKDTWGTKLSNNHYRLVMNLWNGTQKTKIPERKNLCVDMCHECRNTIYNVLKKTIEKRQAKYLDTDGKRKEIT